MAEGIRFYLDENMPVAISTQLIRRGIDVVTVRDLDLLGDTDINHLRRATNMSRVLCTHDTDYVDLAGQGTHHAGIILGQQHRHTIGDWVHFLTLVSAVYEPEEMVDRIEYV